MAETTTDEREMSRAETAEYLRSIADKLESESAHVQIPVGNKAVKLSPPERLDAEVTVTERSRRLRKDTEELELKFDWHPSKGAVESEPESER